MKENSHEDHTWWFHAMNSTLSYLKIHGGPARWLSRYKRSVKADNPGLTRILHGERSELTSVTLWTLQCATAQGHTRAHQYTWNWKVTRWSLNPSMWQYLDTGFWKGNYDYYNPLYIFIIRKIPDKRPHEEKQYSYARTSRLTGNQPCCSVPPAPEPGGSTFLCILLSSLRWRSHSLNRQYSEKASLETKSRLGLPKAGLARTVSW